MYTAKYLCTNEVGPASTMVISQGTGITYRTVVNVHNPNDVAAKLYKKAAGALTERATTAGKISQIRTLTIGPDQVIAVDCVDVKSLLGGLQPNGDGVVVLYSDRSLDVQAAYTMRGVLNNASGSPISINGNVNVVHVPERRVQ